MIKNIYKNQVFVFQITGLSGSGKTTLVKKFTDLYPKIMTPPPQFVFMRIQLVKYLK